MRSSSFLICGTTCACQMEVASPEMIPPTPNGVIFIELELETRYVPVAVSDRDSTEDAV